jgi:transcriptional repressor NrdR
MKCPRCHELDDKVLDTRAIKDGRGIRRRRECNTCGHRFTTVEEIVHAELKVVKREDIREVFDKEKIRKGIEKACWKRPVSQKQIDDIVDKAVSRIEESFDTEVTSRDIGNIIMNTLIDADEVAYVRFASVYRKFKDIEEFIEEIESLGNKK